MKFISKLKSNKVIKIIIFVFIILLAYILYILIYNYSEIQKHYSTILSFDAIKHLMLSPNVCLIRNTTGLPCPGCGLTRAYFALLSFDIKRAFFYHPLFILPPIIFIIYLFKSKNSLAKIIFQNNYLWISLLAIVMTVWLIRFIILFPHTEPFTYNSESLFAKAIRLIYSIVKN